MFERPIKDAYQDRVQQIEMGLKEAPEEEILDDGKWPALLKRACEPYHFRDFVTLGAYEVQDPIEVDGRFVIPVKVLFKGDPRYFALHGKTWDSNLGFEVGAGFIKKTYAATDDMEKKVAFDVENLRKYLDSTKQQAEGYNRSFEGLLETKLVVIHGDLKRKKQAMERARAIKGKMEK